MHLQVSFKATSQIDEELVPNSSNVHGKELEDDFVHKEEKKRERREVADLLGREKLGSFLFREEFPHIFIYNNCIPSYPF